MQSTSVANLLAACVSNDDPGSWEEFVRRYESAIRAGIRRALCRSIYGIDPDVFDDLRQDVYAHLVEKSARVLAHCRARSEPELAAYLARVAHNVVIDRMRARGAQKRGGGVRELSLHDPGLGSVDGTLCREPTPEDWVLGAERRREVSRRCRLAVKGSTAQRDWSILQLAWVDGYSSREIASRFGLSISGVDTIVYRVRQRLRRQEDDV